MTRRGILSILIVAALLFGAGNLALAYANSYFYHLEQIGDSYVGEPWTMKATTDDPDVSKVTFAYYFGEIVPDGTPIAYMSWPADGNNEISVTGKFSYESTVTPDKIGNYHVVVTFLKDGGVFAGGADHSELILPFGILMTIPEVPVIGTLGITIVMLMAFLLVKKRRLT